MTNNDALVERAKAVKARHAGRLMALPGVVGVGVGLRQRGGRSTDEVAIVVMVERKLPVDRLSSAEALPAELEGVPVDVQETGEIRAN
jgi:hypothetical protein